MHAILGISNLSMALMCLTVEFIRNSFFPDKISIQAPVLQNRNISSVLPQKQSYIPYYIVGLSSLMRKDICMRGGMGIFTSSSQSCFHRLRDGWVCLGHFCPELPHHRCLMLLGSLVRLRHKRIYCFFSSLQYWRPLWHHRHEQPSHPSAREMKEVLSVMHSSYLSMAEIGQNKSGKIQNVNSESFFCCNSYRLLPKKTQDSAII